MLRLVFPDSPLIRKSVYGFTVSNDIKLKLALSYRSIQAKLEDVQVEVIGPVAALVAPVEHVIGLLGDICSIALSRFLNFSCFRRNTQ